MCEMLELSVSDLLHSIRMVGEQGDNVFTAASKVSTAVSGQEPEHPAYGLKKDLIRLLANMASQDTENQNKVCLIKQTCRQTDRQTDRQEQIEANADTWHVQDVCWSNYVCYI